MPQYIHIMRIHEKLIFYFLHHMFHSNMYGNRFVPVIILPSLHPRLGKAAAEAVNVPFAVR